MPTNLKADSSNYSTQQIQTDQSYGSNPENPAADFLNELERQLKDVWSQYIQCVEKNGLDETATKLKNRYFDLYRRYCHNKHWKKLITDI